MSDFLVEGHVREYYDIRELELPSREFIHRILKRIRECEKLGIDYEEYIDKSCFQTLLEILDCCLENKDNPNLKRRDF